MSGWRPRGLLGRGLRAVGLHSGLIDRFGGPATETMRLLFDESPSGMVILDRGGRILRANESLARLVGERARLAPGQSGLALFAPDSAAAVAEEAAAALEGRRAGRELTVRLAAGGAEPDQTVHVSFGPIRETDQTISGLKLTIIDITLQKRLETQLAHSQKLQAVGQLAGGIAHDFNNLLTAISGAAEMVLARPALDPEARDDVLQIRASAERGASLVRQLLAFGRQQTMQPRVIAVNDAIREISGLLRRLFSQSVRIELDLETPGRMVRVDPSQLDQVLINLAVNGRDAMPHGGTLTLRSGHITLFRPLVRGEETIPPGRYVMIEVQDTGEGIPAEILPRIFDPFFSTKKDRGGHGLGLSTVHGIVRQSDGFLAVESMPGKGTRLRVYLPRHEAEEELPAPPAARGPAILAEPAPAPRPPGATVLLVEDEEPVRRLAERALAAAGWQVIAAASGDDALALLGSAAPPRLDAVVSDVVMPGIDGLALVGALRASRPGLPAILVSGYADEALRREMSEQDMLFLAKPYAMKALVAAVQSLGGQHTDAAAGALSEPRARFAQQGAAAADGSLPEFLASPRPASRR